MDFDCEFSLRNDLDEIPDFAEAIESLGERSGLTSAQVYQINLVLDELLTNIISYAYQDIDTGSHTIKVRLARRDDQLTAELIDDGKAFDPLREAPEAIINGAVDARPIGGLGLHFMRTLMDEVRYQRLDNCNQLTLIKYIGKSA